MSTDYKTLTDHMISLMNAVRTTSLSDDLSTDVVSVKRGQYVPNESSAKPCVYVRPEVLSLAATMAGNLSRDEKLVFLISGATGSTSRDTAWDDVQCLVNNIQQLLMNHGAESGYWSGGHLGFQEGSYDSPEQFGQFGADSGMDLTVVHFWLRWSVCTRINRE